MNPHIWDVVIEDSADLVHNTSSQLWGYFGAGDPAPHSLDLALFSADDRFDLPRVHLL